MPMFNVWESETLATSIHEAWNCHFKLGGLTINFIPRPTNVNIEVTSTFSNFCVSSMYWTLDHLQVK